MLHTIELITETCSDARLYFLLNGLEASLVKGFAGLTQPVAHRGLAHTDNPKVANKHKVVGTSCFFLSVSSGESGRQRVRSYEMHSFCTISLEHLFPVRSKGRLHVF